MPPEAIARSVCSAISRSPRAQQELDRRGGGELRRAAPRSRRARSRSRAAARRRRRRARLGRARPSAGLELRRARQPRQDPRGRLLDLGALVAPGRRPRRSSTCDQDGHPVARLGREVGAGVERHPLGREEGVQRPAAAAGHRLDGLHVDRVDVRALLAVDLDADEALVHQRRDLGVLEGLALHHVAPVAGRVADRDEDRLGLARARGRAPPRPTGTSRPGSPRAGAGRARSRAARRLLTVGCLSMSHHRETVTAVGAPEAAGPYSHAVKAGGLIFLSGQTPVDPDTGKLVEGDIGAQTRRCLDNLGDRRRRGRRVARARRRALRHLRHRHGDVQGRQRRLRRLLRRCAAGSQHDRRRVAAARRRRRDRRDPRRRRTRRRSRRRANVSNTST